MSREAVTKDINGLQEAYREDGGYRRSSWFRAHAGTEVAARLSKLKIK